MDSILLSVCIFSALFPVSSSAQRKYIYIDEAKNWIDARSYCQEKFTDLATIENKEDMEELKDLATSLGRRDTAWIGLFFNIWSWSMSDSAFYQQDKDFSNWASDQPDNYNGAENCAEMHSNGYWNDGSCSANIDSICSNVSGPDLKFVYITTRMSWTEAQSYCRKRHTDLASVRNMAENRQIMELIPTPNTWIGLYREWKWVDGSHFSFTYWDTENNQPNNNGKNEDCAATYLYFSGKWHDWNCDAKLPFICSRANSSTQYIFIDETKNWTEAQSYCREHYSDLALIKNMEDMNTLINVAKSLGETSQSHWIGLYDDVNSWKWSMSDSDFYQQDEKEFRIWASGQPNNLNGCQYCTEMASGGSWNDQSCSVEQDFICSDVNGANVRFVYIKIRMSWTEAQSYCRKHHTDLASVRNMAENRQVMNVKPVPTSTAWIGLYRAAWKWVDGSNSSFRNWNEEPRLAKEDKCAAANFGNLGKWEDRNCDEKKPFFCYGAFDDQWQH
ncbi:macrophage mannose receptor 1-like [Poecilia reticulata]|uniref:macrophage mannose receptor 1-like n=1 Tax=Poecilia reticulata TaxID=8081 RepID=UPI0004A30CCE|nr:PREDICTED: macrophage mannose receptor 1-like [Poecilia reticulata]